MSIDAKPVDWLGLDHWWSTHTKCSVIGSRPFSSLASEQLIRNWRGLDSWWQEYSEISSDVPVDSPKSLQINELTNSWSELDYWWRLYIDSNPEIRAASPQTLLTEQMTQSWTEFSSWWSSYIDKEQETAKKIADILEKHNRKWSQSTAAFDSDPLASPVNNSRGPLLPNYEEDWSDWLGNLMRSSPVLVTELFDKVLNEPPKSVIREKQLPKKEGTFRRPDILLLYPDHGVHIEVKIDDTNYEKTKQTAELIEYHYPQKEWTHTLLLPKRNLPYLRARIDAHITSEPDDRPKIEFGNLDPVSIICWRDVTAALRKLLREDEGVSSHWSSNAYLFCAAAEQALINFKPQHDIDLIAQPVDVVETMQSIGAASILEEQLTYLRTIQTHDQ